MSQICLIYLKVKNIYLICMSNKQNLEKRIELLEKEVQHLKAVIQYQLKNKKWISILIWIKLI